MTHHDVFVHAQHNPQAAFRQKQLEGTLIIKQFRQRLFDSELCAPFPVQHTIDAAHASPEGSFLDLVNGRKQDR